MKLKTTLASLGAAAVLGTSLAFAGNGFASADAPEPTASPTASTQASTEEDSSDIPKRTDRDGCECPADGPRRQGPGRGGERPDGDSANGERRAGPGKRAGAQDGSGPRRDGSGREDGERPCDEPTATPSESPAEDS